MNGLYYSLRIFVGRYRLWIAFLTVFCCITLLDIAAYDFIDLLFSPSSALDMSFAPEVWLSLMALVVGTLVVIITIASQVMPRIIDVYMNDWASLLYGWSMILSATHAVIFNKMFPSRTSSVVINIALLLPSCILITFPYLFHILGYTKPSNIIRKIFNDSRSLIRDLSLPRMRQWLKRDDRNVTYVQRSLFTHLNQLDNIFHYVSFKELQAQTIINTGTLLREYMRVKEHILYPKFFALSRAVMGDIAFQTLEIQFQAIEESRSFYEQKCFRILGDAYNKFLHENAFDLASLCGSELNLIGETAINTEDEYLMEVILVRFNTMMRSAFKHGVANQEARNLYNLAFHYSTYIKLLALNHKTDFVIKAMWFLRNYGSEVFRNSQTQQVLYFINDVFTFEMKEVLVLISELQWDDATQKKLLMELLEMDNPMMLNSNSVSTATMGGASEQIFHSGVRTLQAGLALFYLKNRRHDFAQMIARDIAMDLRNLPPAQALSMIETICRRLESAVPTFWEDTDRGNNNIYYSPDKDQISEFQFMLMESIQPDFTNEPRLPQTEQRFIA